MFILKFILIAALIMVFIQDIKDRYVYWFCFPIIAICSGVLLYNKMMPEVFFVTIVMNLMFVTFLILIVFVYSKFKLKVKFFDTFGLGDILLFLAITFSFSSLSFYIIFIFSLIFSLLLHLLLKQKSVLKTVPLAGYMSLFFGIIFISHWMGFINSINII